VQSVAGMTIPFVDLSPEASSNPPADGAPAGGLFSISLSWDEHGRPAVRRAPLDLDPAAGPITDEAYLGALAKVMDDCPDCRLARERGETPTFSLGPNVVKAWPRDLLAALAAKPTNSHARERARERLRRIRRRLRR
jgi:hypothetical protein